MCFILFGKVSAASSDASRQLSEVDLARAGLFLCFLYSLQPRHGRLNRTEISKVFSQSVTWCFAQAQTQTLSFKVYFSKLHLIRSLARTHTHAHTHCRSKPCLWICCVQQHHQPSSRLHPAGSPDCRSVDLTDAAVRLIGQASAVYQRGLVFTTTDKFFYLLGFSFRPLCTRYRCGSCTHCSGCLYMQGYFQTEPVKDIHRARGWSGSVLSFLFVYNSSLQAVEVNDGWKQLEEEPFPLIAKSWTWSIKIVLTTFPSQFQKWPNSSVLLTDYPIFQINPFQWKYNYQVFTFRSVCLPSF